jgi:protein phosphatase
VQHAHAAVTREAAANADQRGMGTTLVAVRVVGDLCSIVWVGDSRAYLMRRGVLRAISRDHSFVESLRDRGGLTEAQIQNHPNRNIVTQTLGMGSPVPSSAEQPLRDGDRILLCSDGLNDELTDREIADVLSAHPAPDQAADALVTAALDRGGRDNVTVIVIEYDSHFGKPQAGRRRGSRKARAAVLAGAGAAVVLAVVWWLLSGPH